MLSTNELDHVILHNEDVGIAYVQVKFPWGDWTYMFGMENQVDEVMNDIQSSSMKDPKINE